MRGRDDLEDLVVDRRTILKWIFSSCVGGMDWIHLVKGRDGWPALVNAVMNLHVP